jgi:hypothetical protein
MSLFSAMPVWLTLPGAMSTTCKGMHVCRQTYKARRAEGDACCHQQQLHSSSTGGNTQPALSHPDIVVPQRFVRRKAKPTKGVLHEEWQSGGSIVAKQKQRHFIAN